MRTLITGSPDRVAVLAKLFERAGEDPVTLDQLGPGAQPLDRYIQLGVSVPARGETVVRRIHSFLSDGLLERFAAVFVAGARPWDQGRSGTETSSGAGDQRWTIR